MTSSRGFRALREELARIIRADNLSGVTMSCRDGSSGRFRRNVPAPGSLFAFHDDPSRDRFGCNADSQLDKQEYFKI